MHHLPSSLISLSSSALQLPSLQQNYSWYFPLWGKKWIYEFISDLQKMIKGIHWEYHDVIAKEKVEIWPVQQIRESEEQETSNFWNRIICCIACVLSWDAFWAQWMPWLVMGRKSLLLRQNNEAHLFSNLENYYLYKRMTTDTSGRNYF